MKVLIKPLWNYQSWMVRLPTFSASINQTFMELSMEWNVGKMFGGVY
mgnify:CR=1 FL=1